MIGIEKISIYGGEVVIDYYPTKHRYKKDGQFILSVSAISGVVDKSNALIIRATNLTKDFLLEKMGDKKEITLCADEITEACQQYKIRKAEACDIGTLVHDRAENYARGTEQEIPTDEKVKNGVLAFLKWKTDNEVEFLEIEKLVYSKQYEYVGRFDLVAKVNGKKMLVDYKTSKGFYPMEMGMQTAGYLHAYEEETGEKLDGRMIVMFGKDTGEVSVHNLENYEEDWSAFSAALTLLKRKKFLDKAYKA